LIKPTSGSVTVLGRTPFNFTPEDRQRIGYVSEKQILPANFKVGSLIAFCAQFYPQWDHDLVKRLTERFRIKLSQRISALSNGTQRQVAFILALAQIPFGAVLIALWQLWVAFLLGLALQGTMLLTLPRNALIGILMALCFLPILVTGLRSFGNQSTAVEGTFFFFVDHGMLVALFTFGAFVLVQSIALKRLRDLELICL
jgi:hypothetical protein